MKIEQRIRNRLQAGVSYIYDAQSSDGFWRDFSTKAGVATSWTTGYVLTALNASEQNQNESRYRASKEKAAAALAAAFMPGEGWGYNTHVRTDANSTSWVLMGLRACGVPATRDMVASLHRFMEGDGGSGIHGQVEHPDVTAAALQAMVAERNEAGLGGPDDIERVVEALLRGRLANGGWHSHWYETPAYSTLHALIALRSAGFDVVCPETLLGRLAEPAECVAHSFHTGLVVELLALHGRANIDVVDMLLDQQAVDGRWIARPFLRAMKPETEAPCLCPELGGEHYADERCIFTTATAIRSLAAILKSVVIEPEARRIIAPAERLDPTQTIESRRSEDLKGQKAGVTTGAVVATSLRQEAYLIELERGWPIAASLRLGPPNSIFNRYPRLFTAYFGQLGEDDVELLCHGCRLLASAVVAGDRLADEEVERSEGLAIMLRAQALQFEAERTFARLFPAGSSFWASLKRLLSDAMSAAIEQDCYMTGRKAIVTLSLEAAEKLAVKKTAVAKVALEGLQLLGGKPNDAAFFRAVDAYNLARQLHDDLIDWRDDLAARRPSTMIVRLVALQPDLLNCRDPGELRNAGLTVYYRGLATAQLTRALACLEIARLGPNTNSMSGENDSAWNKVVYGLEKECRRLYKDLSGIATRNISACLRRNDEAGLSG